MNNDLDKIFITRSHESQQSNILNLMSIIFSKKIDCPVQTVTNIPDAKVITEYLDREYVTNLWERTIPHGTALTLSDFATVISEGKILSDAVAQSLSKIMIIEDTCVLNAENFDWLMSTSKDVDIAYGNGAYVLNLVGIKALIPDVNVKILEPLQSQIANLDDEIKREWADGFIKQFVVSAFHSPSRQFYWSNQHQVQVQLVTVASDPTDGYERFVDSCKAYDFPFEVLGMGEPWHWDLTVAPGGGKKVNLLKRYLDQFDSADEAVIVFTDSYDVVINDCPDSILDKFNSFEADVVFSAEPLIWPDEKLAPMFTKPENQSPYIYLNSGGFMGSIRALKQLTQNALTDSDDDQLYYQLIYLDTVNGFGPDPKLKIKLDHNCEIFQTLSTLFSDITVDLNLSKLRNKLFPTTNPSIIHGNGGVRSKMFLNSLCNYVPMKFIPSCGYVDLHSDPDYLKKMDHKILFVVHIKEGSEDNFRNIFDQNYPPVCSRYVFYGTKPRSELQIDLPSSIPYYQTTDTESVRAIMIDLFDSNKADYYFMADTVHSITDQNLIRKLISTRKDIIAPMLVSETNKLFTNFWGDVSSTGYYQRSADYLDIVNHVRRGIWNVPYVNGSMLISKKRIGAVLKELRSNRANNEDFDMYFSRILRKKYIFLHVINKETYGSIAD